jgi:hypothetical protein
MPSAVDQPERDAAGDGGVDRRARADLAVEGWDNGALSIFYRLLREGVQPPSCRTVHRVLVRQGLVVP